MQRRVAVFRFEKFEKIRFGRKTERGNDLRNGEIRLPKQGLCSFQFQTVYVIGHTHSRFAFEKSAQIRMGIIEIRRHVLHIDFLIRAKRKFAFELFQKGRTLFLLG